MLDNGKRRGYFLDIAHNRKQFKKSNTAAEGAQPFYLAPFARPSNHCSF
jgi:hypothetical protein